MSDWQEFADKEHIRAFCPNGCESKGPRGRGGHPMGAGVPNGYDEKRGFRFCCEECGHTWWSLDEARADE
jgi:hypothetical protein